MSQHNNTYPMLSANAWWTLRDQFKNSVPSKITTAYLESLLGLQNSTSARNNVIYPLRQLGIIDEQDQPTELANTWRLDDTYKEACVEMLNNIYPEDLLALTSGETIDKDIVKNWFMKNGVGKAAAGKMTALFILLKDADTAKRGVFNSTKKGDKSKAPDKTPIKQNKKKNSLTESEESSLSPVSSGHMSDPTVHIDLQIHISPESSQEQIEAIFSSMAKYLYRK